MSIKTAKDERGILAAGRVVHDVIQQVRQAVAPGRTTAELDRVAARVIRSHGAEEAPRLVYGFPGAICLCVNDEVVHGIPGPRLLREGDLLTIDVTVSKDGYIADAAVTVPVGIASPEASRLIRCARSAFQKGLEVVRPGQPVWKIGEAVEKEVHRWGFSVVRELCGHGVGRAIHEPPNVPNYPDRRCKDRLEEGLVLTIEPMISERGSEVYLHPDQWTVATASGALSAHYEHTLIVTRRRPVIATAA
jgi:methionyl aminopeptidase